MIEISINGVRTIREENEIYREFVDTKLYDYCKSSICSDEREVIRDWLEQKKYTFNPNNKIIVEYIACKL